MIFKCHDCESEFDEKYAVYYETPGNPKCPVCGGSVAGIRPADLPEAEASAERISSVVRSNATTGWIKISERLPEEGIYVIAFEPHCVNNPDKGIGICEVDSDFTAKKSDGSFWITHWMPLPDAPEV